MMSKSLKQHSRLKSQSEKIAFRLNCSQLHYFEVTKIIIQNSWNKKDRLSVKFTHCSFPRLYRKLHPRVNFRLCGTFVLPPFIKHYLESKLYVKLWVHIKQVSYYFKNNKIKLRLFEGCAKSTMHIFNEIFRTLDSNCTLLKSFEENRNYGFSSCWSSFVEIFFQISIVNIYLFYWF